MMRIGQSRDILRPVFLLVATSLVCGCIFTMEDRAARWVSEVGSCPKSLVTVKKANVPYSVGSRSPPPDVATNTLRLATWNEREAARVARESREAAVFDVTFCGESTRVVCGVRRITGTCCTCDWLGRRPAPMPSGAVWTPSSVSSSAPAAKDPESPADGGT